jgi:hypothetical protein
LNIDTIMQRITKLQRQAIATLILFAMLIAPLCAPLCESRACANSRTQAGDCHSSVAGNAETQQASVGTVRACGLGELPTAALNEATSSAEQLKQVFALLASPRLLFAGQAELIAADTALPDPDREPQENSPIEAAVLRI